MRERAPAWGRGGGERRGRRHPRRWQSCRCSISLGWQGGTDADDHYAGFDYVLHTDVDQLFVSDVCLDMLGVRVGLAHNSFWDQSKAVGPKAPFVPQNAHHNFPYFSAQIYGGTSAEFRRMNTLLAAMMAPEQLAEFKRTKGSTPIYHDETMLNWLLSMPDFMPTVTLSRAFKWQPHNKLTAKHEGIETAVEKCSYYFGCGSAGTHVCDCDFGRNFCAHVDPYVVENKELMLANGRAVRVSHH